MRLELGLGRGPTDLVANSAKHGQKRPKKYSPGDCLYNKNVKRLGRKGKQGVERGKGGTC